MARTNRRRAPERHGSSRIKGGHALLPWMTRHNVELESIDAEMGRAFQNLNLMATRLIDALKEGKNADTTAADASDKSTPDPDNAEALARVIEVSETALRETLRQGAEELEGRLQVLITVVIGE